MNQEQAKAWLPLIQAVADGKTIQSGCFDYFGGVIVKQTWADSHLPLQLEGIDPKYFRIKPEPKKISVHIALFKDKKCGFYWFESFGDMALDAYKNAEQRSSFVKWLDHLEYQLPELNDSLAFSTNMPQSKIGVDK